MFGDALEELCLREFYALNQVQDLRHAPKVFAFDDSNCIIAIQPVAERTARGMRMKGFFTEALFRQVVEAALEVIPALHEADLVHGDVSPHNILFVRSKEVDEWDVIINDFSCSYPIGECPTQYFGTPLYSALSIPTAKGATISYTPICDWESLAWTLLDFALPFTDTFTVRDKIAISAALCRREVQLPVLENLQLHAGDQIFKFLCDLFKYLSQQGAHPQGVMSILERFVEQGTIMICALQFVAILIHLHCFHLCRACGCPACMAFEIETGLPHAVRMQSFS
jgi:serine/threonine protein kinase